MHTNALVRDNLTDMIIDVKYVYWSIIFKLDYRFQA
jgi:hypothetical protein